jgi:hypothetical protein
MNMDSTPTASKPAEPGIDLLSIAAIGIVAFILANVAHEAGGHGVACLLVGGVPQEVSTAHFRCGTDGVSALGDKLISAAGTFANVFAAMIFWLVFRSKRIAAPSLRYFCWFAMSGNLFVAAGYPLFSGAIGVGDWVAVVSGWQPIWLWRVLLTLSGAALYLLAVKFSLNEMATLIGSDSPGRISRAFRLCVIPYLAGCLIASAGSLLNPIGAFVVFTSMSATFGGNSAFAWMPNMLKGPWIRTRSDSMVAIPRNWAWISVAVLFAALHIGLLGPALKLY